MAQLVNVLIVLALGVIAFIIVRRIILPLIGKIVAKTRFTWDDVLFDGTVLTRASWIPAALVVGNSAALFNISPAIRTVITNVAEATMLLAGALTIGAALNAANVIYSRTERAARRPIKGYIQLVKMFLYIAVAIIVIAVLMNQNPMVFLTGLGAMTAVILLIFKDTILSLVASVQLTSNDIIRVGDWIEVPSMGVDGDVMDVALHTVKIRNFDKTISTIPTYSLITNTIRNWRGMQESGGRRIKRSVTIDMSTIRFLNSEEIDRFSKFQLIQGYILEKKQELEAYNREHLKESGITANARRLTNIGTLRAYIVNYLRGLDTIHQEGMTFLIRQLQPNENGLPIELYIFTTTTNWIEYEAIQADIFDHILAIIPEFGLRAYQRPSGADVAAMATIAE